MLSAFLLDTLLPRSIMQQEVVLANRTDYPNTPSDPTGTLIRGSGLVLDPYQAAGGASDIDPPFDKIMRSLAGQQVSVRLLPGTYYTRGFSTTTRFNSDIGWKPWSGLRIVGTSLNSELTGSDYIGIFEKGTILKLTGADAAANTFVIGGDPGLMTGNPQAQADFLDGFEISDLTIDVNFNGGAGPALSGIGIFGRNLLVRRVRVLHFGTRSNTVAAYGISIARTKASQFPAENCIVDSCILDYPLYPTPAVTGKIYGIHMESLESGKYHYGTTVRNCFFSLDASLTFSSKYSTGIVVGGGTGTIIEYNRILNCQAGLELLETPSTGDLTVRHNYVRTCKYGANLNLPSSGNELGRLVILDNVLEYAPSANVSDPIGVRLSGSGIFKQFIIRDNVMRRQEGAAAGSNDRGILIENSTSWTNGIIENNIISVGATLDNGVSHPALPSGATLKVFNNRKPEATFLPVYNSGTLTHDAELTTDVEAVFMGDKS